MKAKRIAVAKSESRVCEPKKEEPNNVDVNYEVQETWTQENEEGHEEGYEILMSVGDYPHTTVNNQIVTGGSYTVPYVYVYPNTPCSCNCEETAQVNISHAQ